MKKRVLVIDDDPRMLRSIKIQLQDVYDIIIVTNGKNALEYLFSHDVDIILLDYIMPDEDGPHVLQSIREIPLFQNIPIIFLTGVSDKDKVKKGLDLNPQGYLLKPISRDHLIKTIDKVLNINNKLH